jgi:hypothetical protein
MLLQYIPAVGPCCRLLTAVGMTGQMRKVERGRRRSMLVTGQTEARTELSRVVQKIVWEHSVLLRMSRILLCYGEAASWVGFVYETAENWSCPRLSPGTIPAGLRRGVRQWNNTDRSEVRPWARFIIAR